MAPEVFQFVISDAGPEGKFVLDLKNGSGSAKAGEEAGAARRLAPALRVQCVQWSSRQTACVMCDANPLRS